MKIAVISDSHDHLENISKVIDLINDAENIEAVLHCGDFVAPFTFDEFKKLKMPFYGVLGNNDGDIYTIMKKLSEPGFDHIKILGKIGEKQFNGRKIAFVHYPWEADGLVKTKRYDAVFYGHIHKAKKEYIDKTLFFNPGEIMGRFGKLSFGIYDTEINDANIVYFK